MTQLSVALPKKQNIQKISDRDPFSLKHQQELQKFNAEMRTWQIEVDVTKPKLATVTDSNLVTEQVLYIPDKLQSCSCFDYFETQCGTCVHIQAVVRLLDRFDAQLHWRDRQKLLNHFSNTVSLDYVTYNSERNSFLTNTQKLPIWLKNFNAGTAGLDVVQAGYAQLTDIKLFAPSFKTAVDQVLLRKQRTTDSRISPWINTGYLNLNPFSNITLFDYQVESVKRMLESKRAALILNMGLGKTLCAITAMHILQTKIKQKPLSVLIICPSTLKKQWAKELDRFMGVKASVINSGKELDQWLTTGSVVGFTILNYELVQRHIEKLESLPVFDVVVFDEVQKIRNKDTKAWRAMKQLKSEYLFALSGTILENSYDDFIAIMEVINELEVKPKWKFVSEFYNYEGSRIQAPKNVPALKKKFHPYLIHPDASKAVKLPGIVEKWYDVKMRPTQESIQATNAAEARKLLAMAKHRTLSWGEKAMLNGYLVKARMAANDARLCDKNSKEVGTKIDEIKKLLAAYISAGEKVVVFSEWHEMLKLVVQDCLPAGVDHVLFHGGIPSHKRGKYIEEFMNNPAKMVFLSTDAGGIGVDGLQLASFRMIHTEPPWNPARVDQRNGRLNRMLQKNLVYVDYIHSVNSIEDMVLTSGSQKREMRKVIMDLGKTK